MKKETEIFCSSCSSTEIIKHGKKDGVQRYRCKSCNKTFILESEKKRHWYSSKEKAFLSMLSDFIDPINDKNRDFKSIISNLDEKKPNINNISLEQEFVTGNKLQCFQPKILICKDGNNIKIYRFNVRQARIFYHREITLIDDNKNSKTYKSKANEFTF